MSHINKKNNSFSAIPSIAELVCALDPVSARWYELGTAFGLTTNDLDGIKRGDPHASVGEWMTKMLNMKMSRSPDFGWSDVTKVLGKISCGAHAESIQQEHCPQGEDI